MLMKRNDTFESGHSPVGNREAFLHLLLSEDLDVLSTELGVSATTLSRWRGHELERVKDALGSLPLADELFDHELFERRIAV
jgi:hypothetical protein